jgi:hypothetical protein
MANSVASKNEFMAGAQAFEIQVGDQKLLVEPKKFSTGSVGYFANGKLTMNIGGQLVKMQANVTLTAIGSKEWPE